MWADNGIHGGIDGASTGMRHVFVTLPTSCLQLDTSILQIVLHRLSKGARGVANVSRRASKKEFIRKQAKKIFHSSCGIKKKYGI